MATQLTQNNLPTSLSRLKVRLSEENGTTFLSDAIPFRVESNNVVMETVTEGDKKIEIFLKDYVVTDKEIDDLFDQEIKEADK